MRKIPQSWPLLWKGGDLRECACMWGEGCSGRGRLQEEPPGERVYVSGSPKQTKNEECIRAEAAVLPQKNDARTESNSYSRLRECVRVRRRIRQIYKAAIGQSKLLIPSPFVPFALLFVLFSHIKKSNKIIKWSDRTHTHAHTCICSYIYICTYAYIYMHAMAAIDADCAADCAGESIKA